MTAPMEPVGPVAQGLSLYAILPADRCDAVRAGGLPEGVRLIAHGKTPKGMSISFNQNVQGYGLIL